MEAILSAVHEHNMLQGFWDRNVLNRDIDHIFKNIKPEVMADPDAKESLTKVIIALSDMFVICNKLEKSPRFINQDNFYNDLKRECERYIKCLDRRKSKCD